MIKAVFTDIDNTLLDFGECAKFAMQLGFEQCKLSFSEEMFYVFMHTNETLWNRIEMNELTKSELFKIRWNIIFNKLNINYDGVKFETIFHQNLAESAICVNNAAQMLEYLSGKYIVCAASNASYSQQIKRLKKADLLKYLKFCFTSEDIGAEKPNIEFFEACFEKLKFIKPCEAIIIGDSLSADIIGGKNIGMKTCWFNPRSVPLNGSAVPDYEIHSLLQIKDIL